MLQSPNGIKTIRPIPCAFHVVLLGLTLLNLEPIRLAPHPVLLRGLLEGKATMYLEPGSTEAAVFKKILPKAGVFTLLTDRPYAQAPVKEQEFHHKLQNYLCPLLIHSEPVESRGILFCSQEAVAQKRLEETGYQIVMNLGNGKGLIEKKP
jgi:hypothetical protein